MKKSQIKIKSAKAQAAPKVVLQQAVVDVPVMEYATRMMMDLANKQSVDAHQILMSMDVVQLEDLKHYFENDRSHMDKKVDHAVTFTPAGKALQIAIDQLKDSLARSVHLTRDALYNKYDTVEALVNDIDLAVAHKVKASGGSSSSGYVPMQE